jgi:uncharacterized membrane protein (UPF0127 family)
MTKRTPGSFGSTIQTLDYSYSDFGSVPTLKPPEISTEPDTSASVVEPDVGPTSQPPAANASSNFIDLFSGDNTPETATIDGHVFMLEVANDGNTRSQGLSRRQLFAETAGMLFVFPTESFHKFWMKEVRFSLDLLYIAADGTIVDIQTMDREPGVLDADLTIYESPVRVPLALEITGGKAAELGLEVGMSVLFE